MSCIHNGSKEKLKIDDDDDAKNDKKNKSSLYRIILGPGQLPTIFIL